METLFCNDCKKEVQYSTAIIGAHKQASCIECGKVLKFLRQPDELFVMPFGKHKGELLQDAIINDRQYFEWLSGVGVTSKGLRERLNALLSK